MPWRRIAISPDTRPSAQEAAGAGEDGELRRQAPHLGRVRRGVAGHAEEHRVAEGQQPDVAEQQVEGAREQREAHHLHQEHRVDHERREREERQHRDERDALVPEIAVGHRGAAPAVRVRHRAHFCVPNRPAGLIMSTIAMMMKITVFEASG